jgi:hypothetical protein
MGSVSDEERYRRALEWIAEYGAREGDLLEGHEEAMRNIARTTLRQHGTEPQLLPIGPSITEMSGPVDFDWGEDAGCQVDSP